MFQNTMNENDKKSLFTRFNDCRQKFVLSLNSITILSLFVLLTTFIPYTTYVGNLVDLRDDEVKELIGKFNQDGQLTREILEEKGLIDKKLDEQKFKNKRKLIQKELIETGLTNKEIKGNFDLIRLEQEWLKKHDPSVAADGGTLGEKSQFRTPLGSFNISNAELVIVYPAVFSALIVYLFFNMYNLYDLSRELKDNYQNKKILQIPTARILLCGILLYSSFLWSFWALLGTKEFPKTKDALKTISLVDTKESSEKKNSPDEISVRLGQIVIKEAHFQINPNLDQWIVFVSTLAVVLAPLIYSAVYWKLFSYVTSRYPKTRKAVSEG